MKENFLEIRIKSFAFHFFINYCRHCEIIKFNNIIGHSKITCEFILYDTQYERRIHLGIEKDEKREIYYPRTFIVERGNSDRFIINQEYYEDYKNENYF